MRDVLAAKDAGDERAALAMEVYTARIREAIGTMVALGGLDAITFADGIGENCPEVRAAIIAPLTWLGVALDEVANAHAQPDVDAILVISSVTVEKSRGSV